jgi:hypothetical protein
VAYRIDLAGYQQLVDSVAAGATTSGATVYDDGTTNPFVDDPFARRQELYATEGLQIALVPAEEIQKIRPIVPQALFPDENVAYDREALTIEEAIDGSRWQPSMRAFVSGPSRPRLRRDEQEDVWSGTARNVSTSLSPMG